MTRTYLLRDRIYRGGTDADHVPIIPGNIFPSDAGHQDESMLISQHLTAQIGAESIRPIASLEMARFDEVGLNPITISQGEA